MGIPSITITFIEKSRSVIARSGAKNAGLIIPLAMTNDNRTLKLAPGDDIPSSVSKYKDQIEQILIGGSTVDLRNLKKPSLLSLVWIMQI